MHKIKFSSFNQPVKCRMCGKLTTEIVNGCIGLELCAKCQHDADMENEHADGGHADAPRRDCPDCQAASVKAEPSTVVCVILTPAQSRILCLLEKYGSLKVGQLTDEKKHTVHAPATERLAKLGYLKIVTLEGAGRYATIM